MACPGTDSVEAVLRHGPNRQAAAEEEEVAVEAEPVVREVVAHTAAGRS